MAKAKKQAEAKAEEHPLAEIFKQAGDGAGLARAVVKALGLARNDYEKRLIVLELEHYADHLA